MRWLLVLFALVACAAPPNAADLRAGLTGDQLARVAGALLIVETSQPAMAASFVPESIGAGAVIWQSRDDLQIVTRDGLVIATRGFGHDLMVADVDGLRAALAGATPQYRRSWTHLDGQLRPVRRSADCELHVQGVVQHESFGGPVQVRVFQEICLGNSEIVNRYRVGPDGLIWVSEQWVSPAIGWVRIERIKP